MVRYIVTVLLLKASLFGQDWYPAQKLPDMRYPCLAVAARIQSNVVLRFNIDDQGRPRNIYLTSGHPFLVTAAVEHLKSMVLRTRGSNGGASEKSVIYHFRLDGKLHFDKKLGKPPETKFARPRFASSNSILVRLEFAKPSQPCDLPSHGGSGLILTDSEYP